MYFKKCIQCMYFMYADVFGIYAFNSVLFHLHKAEFPHFGLKYEN